MALDDVDQVVAVEKLCFPLPWPAQTYRRDLSYNGPARYLVVEQVPPSARGNPRVVGFCGYWLIEDEAHVSTIGVHPDFRGLGLGEYLFASLLAEAMERRATSATLEVRLSNLTAQRLYRKYGFEPTGRRRRYYRDNHEDALLMGVDSIDGEAYAARFDALWRNLMQRLARSPTPDKNPAAGAAS
ncbi:MAG: ribosomal protein S18-alanine N-acetyltransferase [Anaerolineae bacterium]|nr:ribosomal protein S18-alanine N-acetyltransferase [Anaerolineae bacterium]